MGDVKTKDANTLLPSPVSGNATSVSGHSFLQSPATLFKFAEEVKGYVFTATGRVLPSTWSSTLLKLAR